MELTENVKQLSYLIKTYEDVTQTISSAKNRLGADLDLAENADFDVVLKGEGKAEGLITVKGRLLRGIEKELQMWDVWELWLKNVPGIGPWIAGELILLYYYRHVAVCKECGGKLMKQEGEREDGRKINVLVCSECGKKAKDGVLKYRIEIKDFPTISKWWAYMGRHTACPKCGGLVKNENGKQCCVKCGCTDGGVMPKRKAGVVSNWSTLGRTLGFHIGEQFNRQQDSNPYKKFLLERKRKYEKTHPEWKKGHVHNAAKNDTIKLFLSHFWTVVRKLSGLPVSEPYAGVIMGHTNIIAPFFWEEARERKVA